MSHNAVEGFETSWAVKIARFIGDVLQAIQTAVEGGEFHRSFRDVERIGMSGEISGCKQRRNAGTGTDLKEAVAARTRNDVKESTGVFHQRRVNRIDDGRIPIRNYIKILHRIKSEGTKIFVCVFDEKTHRGE